MKYEPGTPLYKHQGGNLITRYYVAPDPLHDGYHAILEMKMPAIYERIHWEFLRDYTTDKIQALEGCKQYYERGAESFQYEIDSIKKSRAIAKEMDKSDIV